MWHDILIWLYTHIAGVLKGLGLTGSGYGLLVMMRQCPAPKIGSRGTGFWFDVGQTIAQNTDRVGERVMADGTSGFIIPPKRTT